MVFHSNTQNAFQLTLDSKKLKSGKYQVAFQFFAMNAKQWSGYALVEPGTEVARIIAAIKRHYQKRVNQEIGIFLDHPYTTNNNNIKIF